MTDSAVTRTPGTGRGRLVLLGGGAGHLHLLALLARGCMPQLQLTWVASPSRLVDPALLPHAVAGHLTPDESSLGIEQLLNRSGATRLTRRVAVLDTGSRQVILDDDQVQAYDWLSIDTGPELDRRQIEQDLPGAREHGLFLWPAEQFLALWAQVTRLPQKRQRSIAVIGCGALALELALAIRNLLPRSAISIVTGGVVAELNINPSMVRNIRAELRRQQITVLRDRALALHEGELALGCGARLACDVPIIATTPTTPAWLGASGLRLGDDGRLHLDEHGRPVGHPEITLATEPGRPVGALAHPDLAQAWSAGPRSARRVLDMVRGIAPSRELPRWPKPQLLTCADGAAIAGWGPLAARSGWFGRWHMRTLVAGLQRIASSGSGN